MTTIDPHTAPIDTIRDWLAERAGLELHGPPSAHPFPPTLDGAASAMPVGWSIKIVTHKGNCQATAWPSRLDRLPSVHSPYNPIVRFHEATTEMEARYRLAAACILAAKENA